MDNQSTVRELKRKRVVLLEELGRIGPLIVGSLAEVGVKCGNPTCRCAKGERHTAYVLTGKVDDELGALSLHVEAMRFLGRDEVRRRKANRPGERTRLPATVSPGASPASPA